MHETNERAFSLNLDIAEIFKPLLVDRAIFSVINRGEIKKEDFEEYIAFNKGVLIFKENLLTVTTRDFARSKDLKVLKNIL